MSETNYFRIIKHRQFQVLSIIDSNDEFESFHVSRKGKDYVATSYRNENDFKTAIDTHEKLRGYGLDLPKQKYVDKKKLEIITPYYSGGDMAKYLVDHEMDETLWEEIFRVYRFCRFSKIDISYLPENFVYVKKTLIYTGKELMPTSEDTNFENWGMRFWINCETRERHLRQLGYTPAKRPLLNGALLKKQMCMTAIRYW